MTTSEIRALLLTDVVDSTRLSEELGDAAMAGLWAAHDRLARDLLPAWRGREIDKTDGMLLLFERAIDAAHYALAYHRALAALPVPLQARAGLHVGMVTMRENSAEDVARGAKPLEVEGLAKPTAARVMSLAGGGQTLLTAEARERLCAGGAHPPVASHGYWMLKGRTDPLELFEVTEPGAAPAAPHDTDKVYRVVRQGDRWLPVRQVPNNLPQLTTRFIGRERELDEIKHMLAKARLLTLIGMGGLGKTRLSLQVAAETLAEYPDGAWFIDLSPVGDPALALGEVAQTLQVREELDQPLLLSVCARLKDRHALLIFDNCEHLVRPVADIVHAILRAAPHVRVLASSRELLHVPGEQACPVAPLPLPDASAGLAALEGNTAVRLFVDRARQHRPDFTVTERDAAAVADLVARLEGIPLALELAATRVRSLSVTDINARLKDRYKLLTGGARTLQERQQTLRALVDWSYDLLGEAEQSVFTRLAVFAGGFELAAAEHVCGSDPLDPLDVLDLLQSLVDKSLVSADRQGDGLRYRMLDTLRDYAREKLVQRGEQEAAQARHCDHFLAFAKQSSRGLQGPDHVQWQPRIEDEHDNLRAAMAAALAGVGEAFSPVKFAIAMQGFWTLRGLAREGRAYVDSALALPAIQASPFATAHALYVGAALAVTVSDHAKARRMLEVCLAMRRELERPVDVAATLSTLSLVRLQAGDASAADAGEREALAIFRSLEDRIGEAIGLLHLGQIRCHIGDDDAAAALDVAQALTLARDLGHQEIEGECELVLGQIDFEAGRSANAHARFDRSLMVCREAGDRRGEAHALWWQGRVAMTDRAADAGDRLRNALRALRAVEMWDECLGCLEDLARLADAEGRAGLAQGLAAAVDAARQRLGLARAPRAARRWQGRMASQAASFAGACWSIEQAVEAALKPAVRELEPA